MSLGSSDKVTQNSIDELDAKLTAYKDQYNQIEVALKASPGNEALIKAKSDLLEVINLTEDLLKVSRSKINLQNLPDEEEEDEDESSKEHPKPPEIVSSSIPTLHQQENDEDDEAILQIGQRCLAKYEADGLYYEAIVDNVPNAEISHYLVTFVGYGNASYVSPEDIAPLHTDEAHQEPESQQSYHDISNSSSSSSSSFSSSGSPQPIQLPKNLKILPSDSDAVRKMKRKRVKAIKSLNRAQQLDQEREKEKNAWQAFQKKSASKVKLGFLSSTKRESIFKSPDTVEGKVGVTGSGRPLTEVHSFDATKLKRQHENDKKNETDYKRRRQNRISCHCMHLQTYLVSYNW